MPYEIVPDSPREEKFAVSDELAEENRLANEALKQEELELFNPKEQELIVGGIHEMERIIAQGEEVGHHSITYYRVVFLSCLFGFEDLAEDAQEAACTIALGKYRVGKEEKKKEEINQVETVEHPDEQLESDNADSDDGEGDGDDGREETAIDDSESICTGVPEDEKKAGGKEVRLSVIGYNKRGICFTTRMSGNTLTFSAQTFGIGNEIELASFAISDLEDDGMNDIKFNSASLEWKNIEGIEEALPAWQEDEGGFYDEAESAYCHALNEILGFENLVSTKVASICGYEHLDGIEEREKKEGKIKSIAGKYGITLDKEQMKRLTSGEKIRARSAFGEVEIDPEKLFEEKTDE